MPDAQHYPRFDWQELWKISFIPHSKGVPRELPIKDSKRLPSSKKIETPPRRDELIGILLLLCFSLFVSVDLNFLCHVQKLQKTFRQHFHLEIYRSKTPPFGSQETPVVARRQGRVTWWRLVGKPAWKASEKFKHHRNKVRNNIVQKVEIWLGSGRFKDYSIIRCRILLQ